MPTVSVVVPNYNHRKYLLKRLDSIFSQSFSDFEVIVVDDSSTDESAAFLNAIKDQYHFDLIVHEVNKGVFHSWADGIERARGDFIWIAEADDYASPDFLSTLVTTLKADKSLGLAYCQSWVVDENNQCVGLTGINQSSLSPIRWLNDFLISGQNEVENYLGRRNTIPNASAVLFRKSLVNLDELRAISKLYRLCGDWLFWVMLCKKTNIAYRSAVLNYFRAPNPVTNRNRLKGKLSLAVELVSVQDYILKNFKIIPSVRRQMISELVANIYSLVLIPSRSVSCAIRVVILLIKYDVRTCVTFCFYPILELKVTLCFLENFLRSMFKLLFGRKLN